MKHHIFIISIGIILVLIALYLLLNNQNQPILIKPSAQNSQIKVTTSFYPLYYFASQIAVGKAQILNITPAGAEPHDYEPTTQDIANIENSNLLILNGGVEAWGDKIKDNLKDSTTVVIISGDGLLTQKIDENDQKILDPHIWLDPILAKQQVEKITEGFIKVDPGNSSFYQTNAQNLNSKLDDLDKSYMDGLKSCESKDIITSHAAFGYLASRYNLNQVPISGLSPDSEPSPAQLADIANFAKTNNVKYIFFESLISPKLAQTIANEVGAQTLVLDPLEGLSNDDIVSGKTYFSVMQDNLKNLQIALECNL